MTTRTRADLYRPLLLDGPSVKADLAERITRRRSPSQAVADRP